MCSFGTDDGLPDSYSGADQSFPTGQVDSSLPAIAVVIVHWMNMEDTTECLASLSRVDYPHLTAVVVNNGSLDFDEGQVQQEFPGALIVTAAENRGVTHGNNIGVAAALENGADMVFLLNPDTVVRPDLIRSLLHPFRDPEVGAVGPVIVYYDAPEVVWSAGGRLDRLVGHPRTFHRDSPLRSACQTRPVDWLSSCALLARREAFERAGPFWEDLFMYFDELEFCLRVGESGYRCTVVGEPLVLHKVSAAGGIRGSNRFSPDKAYYFGRNPFLVFRRHPGGLWILPSLISQLVVVLPYWSLKSALSGNIRVMASYLAGMWDGIIGRTGQRPVVESL